MILPALAVIKYLQGKEKTAYALLWTQFGLNVLNAFAIEYKRKLEKQKTQDEAKVVLDKIQARKANRRV